jgi:hypothetical protein
MERHPPEPASAPPALLEAFRTHILRKADYHREAVIRPSDAAAADALVAVARVAPPSPEIRALVELLSDLAVRW